jgi:hypothetical protein
MEIVLQEKRTLDDVALSAFETFRNGCNYRLVVTNGVPEIEYGCYGVHVNLETGDHRLMLAWFRSQGEERCHFPISKPVLAELMKREPCKVCGGFLFSATKEPK